MSVYVCSDIHGRYDRYCKLLETIKLGKSDILYILGDVIDRNGIGGIDILQDIIKRPNIKLILGNHELFMIECLSYFLSLAEKGMEYDYYAKVEVWFAENNGGRVTYQNFMELDIDTQSTIFDYLLNCPLIKILDIDGKPFHLSHSCTIDNITKDTYKLCDVSEREANTIVWKTPLRRDRMYIPEKFYSKDYTYIVGHVPVQKFHDDYSFITLDNIIDIDCGCAYSDYESRLGCLCLDTFEEFYID